MRGLLFFILFLPGCAISRTVTIDSSFVEGCSTGVDIIIRQMNKQAMPHSVDAMCMDLYVERLMRLNPEYVFQRKDDRAI